MCHITVSHIDCAAIRVLKPLRIVHLSNRESCECLGFYLRKEYAKLYKVLCCQINIVEYFLFIRSYKGAVITGYVDWQGFENGAKTLRSVSLIQAHAGAEHSN